MTFSGSIATAYGSLYRSDNYMASTAYPVTFRDLPMVTTGCYSNTTIMSAVDGGSKTASPNVYAIYSQKKTTNCDVVICVKAEGYTV